MRHPELVRRTSFETEVFLSNEAAIAANTRYVDEDLNRCYLLGDLTDGAKQSINKERKRAHEVDARLGPKGSEEPRCDLVVDLHNTTAATDVALMMAPDDDFAHELGHHLSTLDGGVRIVDWNTQADWPLCASVGRSGMTFEVGPCPWGCVAPELFQRSQRLLLALLDYVELHNARVASGSSIPESISVPVYRFIGISVDYPRADDGELNGMVHPKLQGRDFCELRDGDALFTTFDGRELTFSREEHRVPAEKVCVYPVFINEAAYYEKKIALMLFDKGETTYQRLGS